MKLFENFHQKYYFGSCDFLVFLNAKLHVAKIADFFGNKRLKIIKIYCSNVPNLKNPKKVQNHSTLYNTDYIWTYKSASILHHACSSEARSIPA